MKSIYQTAGKVVGLTGVKLTGVYAGIFSLLSLIFFALYNEKFGSGCFVYVVEGKAGGRV